MKSSKNTPKLVLIPVPISEESSSALVYPYWLTHIRDITCFVVENLRTARRMLRKIGYQKDFDSEVHLVELNRNTHHEAVEQCKQWLQEGQQVGVMSEAGCPGVADPGSEMVHIAHQLQAKVVPLMGPSSILLTLMASGLNGQKFWFQGYVPIERGVLKNFLGRAAQEVQRSKSTILFMDTPYRNEKLYDAVLENCPKNLHLCIAKDVSGTQEFIVTRTVSDWKKSAKPSLHKVPVMFALGQPQSELF